MDTEERLRDYIKNKKFEVEYLDYQKRYFRSARKSDLVLVDLVETLVGARSDARVLDVGCSNGTFLYHLHNRCPHLHLVGGDLNPGAVHDCRSNDKLKGVQFEVMDICDLKLPTQSFDIVVANAVFTLLSRRFFPQALSSIAQILKKGGWLLAFDLFHRYEHEIEMIDYSARFPTGQPVHMRSYRATREDLVAAGFQNPRFTPFEIPLDLASPGDEPYQSRTVKTVDGERLIFRGVIFQPWCHLLAERT